MIIKGNLIKAMRQAKTFEGKTGEEKLYITVANVELTEEQLKEITSAYKEVGKKMTPAWVKEFEGYVNVSTKYDVPTRWVNGEKYDTLEEATADHADFYNAPVRLKIAVKDGAIYPSAIVFDGVGEEYDNFKDFD